MTEPSETTTADEASAAPQPAKTPMPPEVQAMYFGALRKEILAVKARLVWLIVIGLVGVPILSYYALANESLINWPLLLSPILMMLLLVLYFSEQLSMMRAGSFIYEQVESAGQGWEHWVDELRTKSAEPPLFGLLVVVSVAYSLVMASLAMEKIWFLHAGDYSYFVYFLLAYAVPGIYALTFIWVFATLFSFWHSAFHAKLD